MKVRITQDDWADVYFAEVVERPQPETARIVDITDEELADYARVEAEFMAWQDRLMDLYGKALPA